MERINKIINKILTKEIILYIVFGGITTLINLGLFYILTQYCQWDKNIANCVAIIVAVLFAYVTNKDMVFHSNAKTIKERIIQFFKFIAGRAITMIIEMLGGACLFMLPIPTIVSKAIITVIVIILNYIISKFFAFKKYD